MEERWIGGYEGMYSITRCAKVFSYAKGERKQRTTYIRGDGYICIGLYKNDIYEEKYLHKELAKAFLGGGCCYFKDGDRGNVTLENIHVQGGDVEPLRGSDEWVVGFEGHYCISPEGCVYSLKRGIKREMKVGGLPKRVVLHKEGRQYTKYIHRLVAEAYIPNPLSLPLVGFVDGDSSNTHITNLFYHSY